MAWLTSDGTLARLITSIDWSHTPLGALDHWPQSLRTALSTCLASPLPMAIWWGEKAIQLYNEAFLPLLGAKHPDSMGQPASECWAELWHVMGPGYKQAITTGNGTWASGLRIPTKGVLSEEEIVVTFSYSPVRDETDRVSGVLATAIRAGHLGPPQMHEPGSALQTSERHHRDGRPLFDSADRSPEERLRISEERLRLVVESAQDYAIFTTGRDGRIEFWNIGAERVFGWTEQEAVGEHTRMVFTPEDQAAGAAEAEMRQAEELGRAADERWHVRKDGRRFYASGVLVPLRLNGIVTGFAKIARDLTERKQWENALERAQADLEERVRERTSELVRANATLSAEIAERRRAEAQVTTLFERIVGVQEEERRRIARDLHDQLGQSVTALRMSLQAVQAGTDVGTMRQQVARARQLAEEVDRSIDFLTWDLRPAALDHVGFPAALAHLVSGWSERFGIKAEFSTNWPANARLTPAAEANLYRLTQEALHNIHKHAGATTVGVLLEQRPGQALLIIEDDGCGFDARERQAGTDGAGLGLVSMRERASLAGGEFTIDSTPDHGTSIFVRLPLTTVASRGGDMDAN